MALTVGEGILVLAVTYAVARMARGISRRSSSNAHWDQQLVLLVGRIVYIAVLAIGILGFIDVVAPQYLTPTVGAVGLLGLAFGLAFQDVLKNWISGFFLLLERPFRIGDQIRVGAWSGRVETVLLRVTVLRADNGEKVLVPNQEVYTSSIVNSTSYPSRKLVSTARIGDAIELKGMLARGLVELGEVQGIAADPAPQVALVPRPDVGPAIEARYWVDHRRFDISAVKSEVDARIAHLAAGTTIDAGADLAAVRQAE